MARPERLPADVIPKNYRLELQPDLEKLTFLGKLSITTEVRKSTKKVVLNSAEIEIQSAKYVQGAQDATVKFAENDEILTLEFPSELPVGEATIDIAYTGILNRQMRGLSSSTYTHSDHHGKERCTTVTEVSNARQLFPCWDEAAHEATFNVTLIVPRDRVALSNMNTESIKDLEGDLKRVAFTQTSIVSTSLLELMFVVGEFDCVKTTNWNGVVVKLYTPLGKAEHGQFALDIAVKTLSFCEEYFNMDYPLPKMDLIAIPDFAAGAMAKWGLLIYKEESLLVDPVSAPGSSKQEVAQIVGHELTHQWNLVTKGEKAFKRLPTNVVPRSYKLELHPDLERCIFHGKLSITAEVRKPTKEIVLNSAEIDIQSAKYVQGGQDARVVFIEEDETVKLRFPSELPAGEATIDIAYTGTINNQMKGFYRTKYTHPDHPNEERYAAVTQFEPADARRALPCWDEPAHKATFDVALIVPRDRMALSNMNIRHIEYLEGDLKRVTFAQTPIMSSYLLAFIVGEFDYVEATDENGVLVRVYTPVGKAEQGKFALDVAVKTLPFYKDYFNMAYPLPKMDLVAIPDFAAGAMENWGLATYREQRLLVDPINTPAFFKQEVARTVGHELAHQWFGNLVTMEWWTHLWLSEGFATWIQYLCVEYTHPEFELWTYFLTREYTRSMISDSLALSHPIENPVGHPSLDIFDGIIYHKGASIIRMLYHWIGREDFQKGLHNYLTKFAYQNASTDDLWASLAEVSGKPVAMVMSTWTKQMGYPVISVDGKQEGDRRVLTISQKKFCADGNITGFESMQWQVPITIATSKTTDALTFVLDQHEISVTLKGVGPDDWILVNPGRVGYYRVSYSTDLFSSVLVALKDGALSPMDRLGLQNDAFALAKAGMGGTVDVLCLIASYTLESNYRVWENLITNLSSIDELLQYTDFHDSFKKFAAKLFAPTVAKLGWDAKDTDSTLDTMLRSLAIKQHGKYGGPETIAEAQKRFQEHVEEKAALPADLKFIIYSIALANGDENTFDQLIKLHDAATSNPEKTRILACLGANQSKKLIQRCLEFALSVNRANGDLEQEARSLLKVCTGVWEHVTTDKVRLQDIYIVFSAVHTSPKSHEILWTFLKRNFRVLVKRYQGTSIIDDIILTCTSGFVTEKQAKEIEQFFKGHPIISQNCQAIRSRAEWLQRNAAVIKAWLATQ